MSFSKLFPYTFLIVILSLFLYSFTQVDLSLTLVSSSLISEIQRSFQYIGFFNRPLSTLIYLVIILPYVYLLFLFSLCCLQKKDK